MLSLTIKDRSELDQQVAEFQARGNRVTEVPPGESGVDPLLKFCLCGCNGDWTDHTMRAGEAGRCSSVIIG